MSNSQRIRRLNKVSFILLLIGMAISGLAASELLTAHNIVPSLLIFIATIFYIAASLLNYWLNRKRNLEELRNPPPYPSSDRES